MLINNSHLNRYLLLLLSSQLLIFIYVLGRSKTKLGTVCVFCKCFAIWILQACSLYTICFSLSFWELFGTLLAYIYAVAVEFLLTYVMFELGLQVSDVGWPHSFQSRVPNEGIRFRLYVLKYFIIPKLLAKLLVLGFESTLVCSL